MPDPVEWLRAQLDEDEQHARLLPQFSFVEQPPPFGSPFSPLAFQRDRALAEIAARRMILDRYEELHQQAIRDPDDGPEIDAELETAVIALAQPYVDREGFPDQWRTTT